MDIRVLKPSCEKVMEAKTPLKEDELEMILTRYFTHYPEKVVPLVLGDWQNLSSSLMEWDHFRNWAFPDKKIWKKVDNDKHKKSYLIKDFAAKLEEVVPSKVAFVNAIQPIIHYMHQPEKDRKVYIFEGRFFDQFKNVDIKNLTVDHLPKTGYGCIVLPRPIKFGKVDHVQTDELVFCAGIPSLIYKLSKSIPDELRHAENIKNPEDLTSKVMILGFNSKTKRMTHTQSIVLGDHGKNSSRIKDIVCENVKDPRDLQANLLVFNLLAYLKSGKPDIREFSNIIRYRGKSTVHVHPEDQYLSRSRVFLVGYNWLKNPVYKIDGWYSSGYTAWKMCGPGRAEPRLVTFSPSFKQRRKGREELVTEDDAAAEDFVYCEKPEEG